MTLASAPVERSLSEALRALGLSVEHQSGSPLWVSDDQHRVAVLVAMPGLSAVPAQVLQGTGPVVFLAWGPPIAERWAQCPRLAARFVRLEHERAIAWFLRHFGATAQPEPAAVATCETPCVFGDTMRAAVHRLAHDRFGKYTQFGPGRLAWHGELRGESDKHNFRAALRIDRESLTLSAVHCELMPGDANPVAGCLQRVDGLLSVLDDTSDTSAEIANRMHELRAYTVERSQ